MKKNKHILIFLLCVLIISALLPVGALASPAHPTYTLCIECLDEDSPLTSVSFRAYRVANIDNEKFTLSDQFAESDVIIENHQNNAEWVEIAEQLSDYAEQHELSPDFTGQTNDSGRIVFTGVESGIYVVEGDETTINNTTYTPQVFCVAVYDEDVTAKPKFTKTTGEPQVGTLAVTNTVTGKSDKTRYWHFQVELDAPLTGQYGDMEFNKGVATFTLKHGEYAEAINLPVGLGYKAEELDADTDDYKTTSKNAKGKILANETVKAEFINNFTIRDKKPVVQTGNDTFPLIPIIIIGAGLITIVSALILYRRRKQKN